MDQINQIFFHPVYQENFRKLQQAENDRIFCRHTLEHFLDTARLMYIYTLEDHTNVDRNLIYATALLHDLGRLEQIENGTPHDIASARLAEVIMPDCGFTTDEITQVRSAIMEHRGSGKHASGEASSLLADYLYRADKKSRCCFACPAEQECNWSSEKKNMVVML